MKILIAYATIEGHTGKIAEHVAGRVTQHGGTSEVFNTMDRAAGLTLDGYDKVILAASVHERRHPKPFEVFLSAQARQLAAKPTLFMSVSMSAAFAEGAEDAHDYVEETCMRTGFTPGDVICVGGAIKLAQYDFYALQVLRHVVMRGRDFDASQSEHEFTDWAALDARVDQFVSDQTQMQEVT